MPEIIRDLMLGAVQVLAWCMLIFFLLGFLLGYIIYG
jgi:hypothetical protein